MNLDCRAQGRDHLVGKRREISLDLLRIGDANRFELVGLARVPITARLVADLLVTAGASRVVTVDLTADQIQGFFTGFKVGLLKTGYDFQSRLPLNRWGVPDEVAKAALFLASPLCRPPLTFL